MHCYMYVGFTTAKNSFINIYYIHITYRCIDLAAWSSCIISAMEQMGCEIESGQGIP
jgi:hypothetical protein